jgi:hypothetical protein
MIQKIIPRRISTPKIITRRIPTSKIISFVTTIALAISETLPFIDTKANGILHEIKIISDEYTTDITI